MQGQQAYARRLVDPTRPANMPQARQPVSAYRPVVLVRARPVGYLGGALEARGA